MAYYDLPLRFLPMRWSLEVTETGTEPVSLADLKDQSRIDTGNPDEDAVMSIFGQAARRLVEQMTNRAIVAQTRVLRLSSFPDADRQFFELPGGYIRSVASITWLDTVGDQTAFTGFQADIGTQRGTGRVHLAPDESWPGTVAARGLPVAVTYEAGYDPAASPPVPVPQEIGVLIRMIAADMFENRETSVPGTAPHHNPAVDALVNAIRVPNVR